MTILCNTNFSSLFIFLLALNADAKESFICLSILSRIEYQITDLQKSMQMQSQ